MRFTSLLAFAAVAMVACSSVEVSAVRTAGMYPSPATTHVVSLGGLWSVRNANGTISLDGTALVPGDIYTDLQRNGIIGDPLVGYGDLTKRWVAYDNWTYYREVAMPAVTAGRPLVGATLRFEGLQVVATIRVNGIDVAHVNSDFKAAEVDLGPFFKQHGLTTATSFQLEVAFVSSAQYALGQFLAYPSSYEEPVCPAYLQDIDHRNFIRAEQSSFGWDWGPAFAPMGIYGPCEATYTVRRRGMDTFTAASVGDVAVQLNLRGKVAADVPLTDDNNSFVATFNVSVNVLTSVDVALTAAIASESLAVALVSYSCSAVQVPAPGPTAAESARSTVFIICTASIVNGRLWWPRGYGDQVLHDVAVHIVSTADTSPSASLATEHLSLGLRSAELVTWGDPLRGTTAVPNGLFPTTNDTLGVARGTMFFRVNGLPIYAKGANVIPYDAFRGRTNTTVVDDLLDSAIAANMNMVRVWGGGIFKEAYFYEQCDALGILVWQEMTFACAEYPINGAFLDLVTEEMRYQVRRLSRYSSIVLWSGNNENDVYDKGPGSPYEILDYETVLQTIITTDASRPIWPSSPSEGFASGTNPSGQPAGTTSNPLPFVVGKNRGGADTHYYNYFQCPDLDSFPKTSFASEYGFQSLPWFDNIEPVSTPSDWSLFSAWMDHRQHHPNGNEEIAKLFLKNFPSLPNLNDTDLATFKRVIYLSQLQQTICITEESNYYRRGRSMPYRTMGALYWQLNQNWQAPSWTSLEYGGEWKLLHYGMRDTFNAVHLTAFVNSSDVGGQRVYAHIASDALADVVGAELRIELVPLLPSSAVAGRRIRLHTVTVPTVPARSGVFAWFMGYADVLSQMNAVCPACHCDATSCVLEFSLVLPASAGIAALPAYTLWLGSLKDVVLDTSAAVKVTAVSLVNASTAVVDVSLSSTEGPAVYVFLRSPTYRGYFSENRFTLVAGEAPRRLTFKTRPLMTDGKRVVIDSLDDFVGSITIDYLNQRV